MNFDRLAKNVSANMVKVVVNTISALVLPRLLLGVLDKDGYAIWVLIVQISMYSVYLDIGISTVVGRFVAYYGETGDLEARNRFVSSGLALLVMLGSAAFIGLLFLVSNLGQLFTDIPTAVQSEAAISLFLVGTVTLIRLPSTMINAVFIGLQRNEFPSLFLLINRFLTIAFVGIVAFFGGRLLVVAVVYCAANLIAYAFEIYCYRKYSDGITIARRNVSYSTQVAILTNSFALAIWSFGSLLTAGLDTTVVGILDFASLAAFSFATTLAGFVSLIQASVVNVIMPYAATLAGREDHGLITALLLRSTRYGVLVLLIIGIPLIVASPVVIALWVGERFVSSTVPILIVMVFATIIRQSTLSFSMTVVGIGKQNMILLSPLLGGTINLVVSIAATMYWGAIGAAFGTLVGGLVEFMLHIFWNLPRITEINLKPTHFLLRGFLKPFACAIPGFAIYVIWIASAGVNGGAIEHLVIASLMAASIAATGWSFIITPKDRGRILGLSVRLRAALGIS